ncbi:hypothetical protein WA026_010084 [Henosepilachna vigintioctopunctata]|uniref:Uncharacterized protein n=1 Tax=Henosepilachna vigintioctopunctata TaxID=420089 RepID=A0AAW1UHL7_9CUCU
MITAKCIEELTEIFEILRPIEVATKDICGEDYVTSRNVTPITRMLNLKMNNIKTKSSMCQDLKENIMTEISKRLLPSEHVQILAVSTSLPSTQDSKIFTFEIPLHSLKQSNISKNP